jgi:Protein of unknown function (DUF3304)
MERSIVALLTSACFALGACDPKASQADRPESPASSTKARTTAKSVNAELTGYNHTDKTIGAFYVNGQWGGNITPGSGGGSFVCCVELPVPWHEGLTVTVRWEDSEGTTRERQVVVPQYDPKTLSIFNVHFLRNNEIRVFAANMILGHPDYPLSGKEAERRPNAPVQKVE